MNKSVIIVAGGQGLRMNAGIPKQFMELNGKPILMHTIKRFHDFQKDIFIVVVLPEGEIETWKSLQIKHSFTIPHQVIAGGPKRFHSVKNGLAALTNPCIVAIHDGVRPLCSAVLIKRCFDEAEKKSNAIPSIQIPETIREITAEGNTVVDREKFRIIQTPQCFDSWMLKKAYEQAEKKGADNFTDDAGVFENDGNKINLVEGERYNIKITVQEDLIIASVIEKNYFS